MPAFPLPERKDGSRIGVWIPASQIRSENEISIVVGERLSPRGKVSCRCTRSVFESMCLVLHDSLPTQNITQRQSSASPRLEIVYKQPAGCSKAAQGASYRPSTMADAMFPAVNLVCFY